MKKRSTVLSFALGLFLGATATIFLTANPVVTGAPTPPLTAVAHDATLTGNGTTALPLGVANGQVVKGLNGLTDNVALAAGSNITITPSGNTLTIASNQLSHPFINPLRVATLQWYEANQTNVTYSVPSARHLTFDGVNMWVTNYSSDTITKLRASDGASLGTYSVGGNNPNASVFDGENIWVTCNNLIVTKLRASNGELIGTFGPFSGTPGYPVFDGANIWVAAGSVITKLRATDGAILGNFNLGVFAITGLAFDGANIWVSNFSDGTITKLRASDGFVIGTFTVGEIAGNLAFDGENIWVVNRGNGNCVTKVRASDGVIMGTFSTGWTGYHGIAFDGANVWVSNPQPNSLSNTVPHIVKLRASDGFNLGIFTIPGVVGESPGTGVAFDGTNIWVTGGFHNTVTKL